MVVEHGQRMTATAVGERDMALEIHPPEQVRGTLFKALQGSRRTRRRPDAVMPSQDLVRGRARQRFDSLARDPWQGLERAV